MVVELLYHVIKILPEKNCWWVNLLISRDIVVPKASVGNDASKKRQGLKDEESDDDVFYDTEDDPDDDSEEDMNDSSTWVMTYHVFTGQ